ncbi:MBL fold metallo-hydrolase [Paenibacillus cymbidii]|uniref:MBL fold metallo-hydrolase n=1 Tax=Paenibacillus cymbidii TaxID=1639034 RepID=UPI001F3B935E|nr:MBL fold metallo-hydrolase [Paenibacillus cymbidii]
MLRFGLTHAVESAIRMRIAAGIDMLELNAGNRTLCPTILYDDERWYLVDTGLPGNAPLICDLAQAAGMGDRPLGAILLTHQDIDHIGGLPGFRNAEGSVMDVYAHNEDRSAIDGTGPMLKVSPERLATLLESMPAQVRSGFEATFLHPNAPNVTRTFADGDELPIAGGLTVIHTPGHTPGHVSLYHRPSKTLIAGDAMVIVGGELQGPIPAYTPILPQALQSLRKLTEFDVDTVICYHGGCLRTGVNARISKLAASL